MSENKPELEYALSYAALGWHVFPLKEGSKAPATARGHLDATTDEEQIRKWWGNGHRYGVGVALAPSGLVALDVDVKGGAKGRESLERLVDDLTSTAETRTPSGGGHLIYRRTADDQARRIIGWRPGLDLLGDGYIVAPGTEGYDWEVRADPEPTPPVLARGFLEKRTVELNLFDPDTPFPEGKRNSSLYAMAGKLREAGASIAAAESLVRETNQRRCVPPLGDAELNQILRSAWRGPDLVHEAAQTSEARGWSMPEAPDEWELEVRQAQGELISAMQAQDTTPAPMGFVSAAELSRADIPRPEWYCHRLITTHSLLSVSSGPKNSKTWMCMQLGISIAQGRMAFGKFATKQAPVLYVFAEDGPSAVQGRLNALTKDPPANFYLRPAKGDSVDLIDGNYVNPSRIIAEARKLGPEGVIFLDPMRNMHSKEENSSTEMSEVMQVLLRMRDITGWTVVFVHHSKESVIGKEDEIAPGLTMRGSSAIHAGADGGIYLFKKHSDKQQFANLIRTELKTAAGAEDFMLELNLTDDDNGFATEAEWVVYDKEAMSATMAAQEQERQEERNTKMLSLLDDLWDKGAWETLRIKTNIYERFGGDRNKAQRTLQNLLADGRVLRVKHKPQDDLGHYGKEQVVFATARRSA